MKITIKIPDENGIVKKLKIGKGGIAQTFHTNNVLRHMTKYLPMETGMFLKQAVIASSTEIQVSAPQAYYLYFGKRMVDSKTGKGPRNIPNVGYRWRKGATLVPTNQPLNYTKTFHPLAGPFWDERMMQAEGDVIANELKEFIERNQE